MAERTPRGNTETVAPQTDAAAPATKISSRQPEYPTNQDLYHRLNQLEQALFQIPSVNRSSDFVTREGLLRMHLDDHHDIWTLLTLVRESREPVCAFFGALSVPYDPAVDGTIDQALQRHHRHVLMTACDNPKLDPKYQHAYSLYRFGGRDVKHDEL
jgi:hypothetical protein